MNAPQLTQADQLYRAARNLLPALPHAPAPLLQPLWQRPRSPASPPPATCQCLPPLAAPPAAAAGAPACWAFRHCALFLAACCLLPAWPRGLSSLFACIPACTSCSFAQHHTPGPCPPASLPTTAAATTSAATTRRSRPSPPCRPSSWSSTAWRWGPAHWIFMAYPGLRPAGRLGGCAAGCFRQRGGAVGLADCLLTAAPPHHHLSLSP